MPPKPTGNILQALRALMRDHKVVASPIQAYIIPSGDAHQNEYVSAYDCRRDHVTGFTGSAGTAVVTQKEAALWVDGRYYLQAEVQTDDNWKIMKTGLSHTPTIPEWLAKTVDENPARIGADPSVMAASDWRDLKKSLQREGHELVPVVPNLVDLIWKDRPGCPNNPLIILDTCYSGAPWFSKISRLREEMSKKSVDTCVLTALDDIAWLLNLRGSDIQCNPVFYSYAIVTLTNVSLFIDETKITDAVRNHLTYTEEDNSETVVFVPYYEFYTCLSAMVADCSKIWINDSASQKLHEIVPENKQYVTHHSHVYVMKSVKNAVEIEGMRNAHNRDAVTLCEFFSWLENEVKHNNVTESQAADKLEAIKRDQPLYVSLSFDTISSSGPNAALNHYKAIPGEDLVIDNQGIYLLDSGAQYMDGTTDVTRTVHFGIPTAYQKECYTRVLKGHIQLATAIWPKGVKGVMLDTLARMHLWSAGLNYRHGTGHGVGSFLNVHEGPCSISFRSKPGEVSLEEGMIVTDEPGYYEDGEFGIRIENCMLIKQADTKYNFDKTGYLTMESLTLVPISTKLIEPSLLTDSEITWLNSYHEKCREVIAPMLKATGKDQALKWLMRESEPLG